MQIDIEKEDLFKLNTPMINLKNILYLILINIVIGCIYLLILFMIKISFKDIDITFLQVNSLVIKQFGGSLIGIIVVSNIILLRFIFKGFKHQKEKYLLDRYEYLIGEFNLNIESEYIFLNSKSKNININIKNSTMKMDKEFIIITQNNGFKMILPIEKIENDNVIKELKNIFV